MFIDETLLPIISLSLSCAFIPCFNIGLVRLRHVTLVQDSGYVLNFIKFMWQ